MSVVFRARTGRRLPRLRMNLSHAAALQIIRRQMETTGWRRTKENRGGRLRPPRCAGKAMRPFVGMTQIRFKGSKLWLPLSPAHGLPCGYGVIILRKRAIVNCICGVLSASFCFGFAFQPCLCYDGCGSADREGLHGDCPAFAIRKGGEIHEQYGFVFCNPECSGSASYSVLWCKTKRQKIRSAAV